jgi:hypothetical protein
MFPSTIYEPLRMLAIAPKRFLKYECQIVKSCRAAQTFRPEHPSLFIKIQLLRIVSKEKPGSLSFQ